jgi:hypothetical protein
LIETDAPDDIEKMPSVRLIEVVKEIGKIRGMTIEEVSKQSRKNFLKIINNDKRLDKFSKIINALG